ncbi:MAG: FumA C-terminus/TtdB family hydratase beta subunit [Clostridia bacterium]|nr:FumA C-terminus/TtdB family hydratase beta subunit [Clostridia bacterium]
MKTVKLNTPIKESDVRDLHVGDVVYITGHIYTSRDMAHKKYKEMLERGEALPKDFNGYTVYHAGPVCLKNAEGGWDLQLIGPTTSIRMEPYADMVGEMGVKFVIGKGGMDKGTLDACAKYGYAYLQAAPGCAAKGAECVKKVVDVHYLEMGMPEALWDLEVVEFGPLVVGMDTHGESVYANLKKAAFEKLDRDYPL